MGGSYNKISNCNINKNSSDGVQIGNSGTIINNTIDNNGNIGINIVSEKCILNSNRVINNSGDGIYINNSNETIITDNNIDNNTGNGIQCNGSGDNIIGNNTINNNTTHGIYLIGSSTKNIINNNKVISCTIGIYISGTSHDCTISNNIVNNNRSHGIQISSNTNIINGNRCILNGGDGIVIDNSSTDNTILANDLTGNTGNKITDNGTITSALPNILINEIDSRSATTLLIGGSVATKVELSNSGIITEVKGNLDVLEGLDVIGNITVTDTVDGRDINVDGTNQDAHIAASSDIHGISGNVIGTTDIQTLTN